MLRGSRRNTQDCNADFPMPVQSVKEQKTLNLSDYELKETLGTGTFGRVRLVKHIGENKHYALKILKKAALIKLKQVEHIKNEVKLLSMITHPMIVNMPAFVQDENKIYLLFEFVPGGELFTHLRTQNRFPEDLSKFYAASIVLAFGYMHHLNVIYRDLKPENLLLTREGYLKITDFGFAKYVEDRTWTLCGTPEYLAPEIIQSKGHGKSVDWWATGILIYEMMAGYPPFYDDNPFCIYQKILHSKVEFPRFFDPKCRDLIKKLLQHDTTRRIGCIRGGASKIQAHKWFSVIDWQALLNQQIAPPFLPTCGDEGDTSNFDEYPESEGDDLEPLLAEERRLFDGLGVEAGGVEAGGVEAGGVEAGGVEAGGVEAGGVEAGGVAPKGPETEQPKVAEPSAAEAPEATVAVEA